MALTNGIFGVLGRWSPAAGDRTWKFDCIITLNLCLLRRCIADIPHRGMPPKQHKQFGKVCFKLDYRFTL